MQTIDKSTVDDVVEHVNVMAEKYGFTLDKDCVRDCVEESANLLGHLLTGEEIATACDRILNKA